MPKCHLRHISVFTGFVAGLFSLSAWGAAPTPAPRPPASGPANRAPSQDPSAEEKLQRARFSPDKMDLTVDPRKDFVKFAAGNWYATTPIPSDKSRWGGFDELSDANWARIREVIEDAKNPLR